MRFRQLTCPTAKNFYDVCLDAAPFYQNELIEGNEREREIYWMKILIE